MALAQFATQAPTIVPLTLIYEGGEDISDMEATDPVIVSDTLEQIDIGGAGPLHGTYLRVSAPDLVVAFDALRRLIDQAEAAVLDARQDRMDEQRHECPGCPILLEPDEETCGSSRCNQLLALDMAGLIP